MMNRAQGTMGRVQFARTFSSVRERRLGTRKHNNGDNNSARFYNGEKLRRAEWRVTYGIGVHAIPGSYPVNIVWAYFLLIMKTTLICQLIVTVRASCLLKADLILKDLFVTPVELWL